MGISQSANPSFADAWLHAGAQGVRAADLEGAKAAVRDELANAERAAKAIQDKLDRLDEAFLFERSIDIETYDRHAEKLREERTLARIERHSGQLEELDVEGILAFAERVLPRARISGCRRHSNSASGSNNCSFRTESHATKRLCWNHRNRTGVQLLARNRGWE
jgi:hypothetical protein